MEIKNILTPELVIYPLESDTKEHVISKLVDKITAVHPLKNPAAAKQAVLDREAVMTTGIGKGVALPHGKYRDIEDVYISAGISNEGIDFDAVDQQPVHILILLLTPERYPNKHLKLLRAFSRMLNHAACREELIKAHTAEEITSIMYKYEAAL